MGRRTLLLITSILIAAVGTALIGLYVRGANDRAQGDTELRPVLVASHNIASGDVVTSADLAQVQRRSEDLPKDAVDTSSSIIGKSATSSILAGQVLQNQMLGAAGTGVTTGGISANQMGIMIELADPERAAGLLKVGSKIDVFEIANKTVNPQPVLESATVIQIGNQNVTASNDSTTGDGTSSGTGNDAADQNVPTTLVGLSLIESDVVKVKDAEAKGSLFFAVLPGTK